MARKNSSAELDERNPGKMLVLGFLSLLILSGCSAPSLPLEGRLAELMRDDLWKAEAPLYAPEEYTTYLTTYRRIKDDLIKEEARPRWFRDYKPIAARLNTLLKYGERALKKVEGLKESKRTKASVQLSELEKRLRNLDRLSLIINEGRLVRRSFTKGEMMIHEAAFFIDHGDYDLANDRLKIAAGYIKETEDGLFPILSRYTDAMLMEKWNRWMKEVVAESEERNEVAIVVSKIDRSLTIYKDGRPYKTYGIGLGKNGFQDKLRIGDGATPEGSYRIIKKLDRSQYYKALLLNYPNEEDQREFLRLKKKGVIPRRADIGGLIEIHGGGKDGMTYGCISLDDGDMDELFNIAMSGTPVAIVGATNNKTVKRMISD